VRRAKVYLECGVASVEGNAFGRVVLDEGTEVFGPGVVEEAEVAVEGAVPSYYAPGEAGRGTHAGF